LFTIALADINTALLNICGDESMTSTLNCVCLELDNDVVYRKFWIYVYSQVLFRLGHWKENVVRWIRLCSLPYYSKACIVIVE